MLRNKFSRHTIAFLAIVLGSVLLYPLAQAGLVTYTWFFLGLVILTALLTLTTK